MAETPPFFVVWRANGRSPVFQHGSERDANAEADRLSIANPGERFYVLVPVSSVRRKEVERERYGVTIDDVPF